MQSETFEFPQYRKYVGIDIYFKIESQDSFLELSKTGDRVVEHNVVASQYPEKLRIKDMLSCLEGRWEQISKNDFLDFKNQ